MKRSGPLRRGKPLERRTPLPRATKPLPRRSKRRVERGEILDVTPETRAAVMARAGYRCEVRSAGCSDRNLGAHHRLRREFGDHRAENLVVVCQDCHTDSPAAIHRNPAWAVTVGLVVPSWAGPPAEAWDRSMLALSGPDV